LETQHLLEPDAVDPTGCAGVPGPSAAPSVFAYRVNVGRDDVRLLLVTLAIGFLTGNGSFGRWNPFRLHRVRRRCRSAIQAGVAAV